MSWIARLAFVPIGISIADACTVVDTIKAQNTVANARILKSVFRLVKMTALGIALIVIGLTLVCGSMIFRMFSEPSSSEESFEERLEQTEHHLDEMRKERRELLEDGSAPAEHVPNDRKRRDE
jgi:hypothetical protein